MHSETEARVSKKNEWECFFNLMSRFVYYLKMNIVEALKTNENVIAKKCIAKRDTEIQRDGDRRQKTEWKTHYIHIYIN